MNKTMNFVTDTPCQVDLEGNLRMILWAGDCVHNEITDVERLPDFDVYLCYGFIQTLQANIDYIYKRSNPGIICIIDVTNKEQMGRFIELFRNRFDIIDSDYHGNTPSLPMEYYQELLSTYGRAFNIKGINGCIMPTEDYQNTLELFAPLLSPEDNYKRIWTSEFIELANGNQLTPNSAWVSPDLKHPYYDGIRDRQIRLMEWNKNRNPIASEGWKYSEKTIEDYWRQLPIHILTVNFERSLYDKSLAYYIDTYGERFREFITELTVPLVDTKTALREYSKINKINKIQKIYRFCKEYPSIHFGYIKDNRYSHSVYDYSHWITKNNAL